MKNIITNINLCMLAVIASLTVACKKDFLNVTPPNQLSADVVWSDPVLAEAYMYDAYKGLVNGGFSEQMLASVSDEALFNHTGRGIDVVNTGNVSPSTTGWIDDSWNWDRMYLYIRTCNTAIDRVVSGNNQLSDQAKKDQILGEAYFLRAYYYQQLLRFYGGVPIITNVYDINDDLKIKRNTYDECVNFIIKDCEEANKLLSGKSVDKGRATALAALALKSRVLLYAASDLHDRAKLTAKISGIADQALPLLSYTSGSQADRYRLAQAAAKAVLDADTRGGYKLNLSAPVSAAQGTINHASVAMGGASKASTIDPNGASEIIFAKYFLSPNYAVTPNLYNGPNGYHNWGGNNPIGQLVDDYEMLDGTPFSWSNAAAKANPYQNRDPRFYATILYDGANWKPRDKVSGNVDPANQIQTGSYDLIVDGKLTTFSGLDTKNSSIENWNGSYTGYYYRKFTDPDPNVVDQNTPQTVPWQFFRYTEAVLNYVEASIELGETSTAVTWLNKIRFRAGMPAVTATDQASLRSIYRHERRIEMAFEEQRYHDVRRWLIAGETLGRKVSIVTITGKFKAGKSLSFPYAYNPTIYDYTYTPSEYNVLENRAWNNALYFRPITRDEINKNNLLIQNPGY
jgi:hypothetical protein